MTNETAPTIGSLSAAAIATRKSSEEYQAEAHSVFASAKNGMGDAWWTVCARSKTQQKLELVLEAAAEDDVIRRIRSEYDDVILFSDGTWFDVRLAVRDLAHLPDEDDEPQPAAPTSTLAEWLLRGGA
jgi:hypothetical protein